MKNRSKLTAAIFIFAIILAFNLNNDNIFAGKLIDETKIITIDNLKLIKPPADFRNYFMLQSIDDTSVILIGDFVGVEKVITLIIDEGSDNTINSVVEYYPEKKKFRYLKTLSSKFLKSDLAGLKKEIIEGVIFEKNYSYNMATLKTLKKKLNEGTDIFHSDAGWVVIIYDPESTSTPMTKFYFKSKENRYDLIFETKFYKLYNIVIQPPITFSVYCKNSKDPIIAEYVKELLKMLPL